MLQFTRHPEGSPFARLPGPKPGRSRRRGLTLVETVLGLSTSLIGLGALVVISHHVRADDSQARTREMLQQLRDAAHVYHERHGVWPPSPTHQALEALLGEPELRGVIDQLQPIRDAQGRLIIRDGFGSAVRYLPPAFGGAGQPDFVSAGGDGRFGEADSPEPTLRFEADEASPPHDQETPTP